jgi:uridine phosphorylase
MIPSSLVQPVMITTLVIIIASTVGLMLVGLDAVDWSDTNKSYVRNASYSGFGLAAILVAALVYQMFFVDQATRDFKNYRVQNIQASDSFFGQQMDGNLGR